MRQPIFTLVFVLSLVPPALSQVELVRSGSSGVEFRFSVPAPTLGSVAVGDRQVAAAILPELGPTFAPGYPVVPARRVLLEVPAEGDVSLSFTVDGEQTQPFALTERAPRVSASIESGDLQVVDVPAATGGLWPAQVAELEYVGYFRDRRVASVKLHPVRVDLSTGMVTAATSIRAQLHFAGGASVSTSGAPDSAPVFDELQRSTILNYGTFGPSSPAHQPLLGITTTTGPTTPVRNPGSGAATRPAIKSWALRIEVKEQGIYAITAQQLRAAGVEPSDVVPQFVAMSNQGQPVAIIVENYYPGAFTPIDRILFYGEPATGNYTSTNVYWLTQGTQGTPLRMASLDGTFNPSVPSVVAFRGRAHSEFNLLYYQQMQPLAGPDHWFWTRKLAPTYTDYGITLTDPFVPGSGSVQVRGSFVGYTDTLQDPDHHVKLFLNANPGPDATWNGLTSKVIEGSFSEALIGGGANIVSVQQISDTGAIVDGIYLNWVEIDYDRQLSAVSNALAFSYASPNPVTFTVRNFTNKQITALEITDPKNPKRIDKATFGGAGSIHNVIFTVVPGGTATGPTGGPPGTGGRYFAAAKPAFKAPAAMTLAAPALKAPAAGADLIVITPPELQSAVQPLIDRRVAQGKRVAVLDPARIYDSFGFGLFGPVPIRAALQWAFTTWTAPAPSYVLIVGESSLDYLNYLAAGVPNQVPTATYASPSEGEIPSDYFYACLVGADPLPEVILGRIPGKTPAEVSTIVQKILKRETAPPAGPWKTRLAHVADAGGTFVFELDTLQANHVPPPFAVMTVYKDNFPSAAAMAAAINGAFNTGNAILTYLGHGAIVNMGSFYSVTDVAGMSNGDLTPVVSMLNCLNGYYASPTTPHCLAEEMLLKTPGGAVSCFAPVGAGFLGQLTPIAAKFYDRIFAGQTLGSAVSGSKLDAYLFSGVTEEYLWEEALLGDPLTPGLPPP